MAANETGASRPPFLIPVLVAGIAFMALLPVILMFGLPPAQAPLSPCGSEPTSPNPVSLAPGQTSAVYTQYGGGPGSRVTVWSDSTASYTLFVLTGDQYVAYGNATGSNGTTPYHPPSSYYWTSGPTTSTNDTVALGNGDWYVMVYNPGSSSLVVNIEVASCSSSGTGPPLV
jgi:hypothetical protein